MAKKFDDNLFEDVQYTEPKDMQDDLFEDVKFGEEPEAPSMGESALRGVGQGLTFDYLDEIIAAFKSKGGATPREMIELPVGQAVAKEKAMEKSYQEELAKTRKEFDAAREANPYTYMGSELVGGIAPALLSGGAALVGNVGKQVVKEGVKSLTKKEGLQVMGQAAKTGAGFGAASASGYSEADTPQDLAADIAKGAAMGAGLGAATPIAGKVLSKAGRGVKKVGEIISDKIPSVSVGFKFGEKYGLANNKKINNLFEDNTRKLVKDIKKSFEKLGMDKKVSEKEAAALGKTYDLTDDIQDIVKGFRAKTKGMFPEDVDKANKMISNMEEGFLRVDVQRNKLIDTIKKEVQKKAEKSANLQSKAIQKAESRAVQHAEKEGVSLEQLEDIKKGYKDVSDLPYDTKGGKITGQKAKFKDEYMDIETGEMVPYEYSKKYISDTTPFKPSGIRTGDIDDKLVAQYTDEATGEVFTKMGPKSRFSEQDFSKMSVDEMLELLPVYGEKAFEKGGENAEVYKSMWKMLRNKLPEISVDLPKNKQEMAKLFETMSILGVDKGKLKYPSGDDIVKLAKKLPGKMDVEKDFLSRHYVKEGSEMGKSLDELKFLSEAKKYLGEGYSSPTGEFTQAGMLQKGVSSITDILGAGYGAVKKPISKVANKVAKMSDDNLQQVSKSFNSSNNEGLKAMGRQLDEALKQEGPVKSALIWSLSQNPAFRKAAQQTLPELDEFASESLGSDVRSPLNDLLGVRKDEEDNTNDTDVESRSVAGADIAEAKMLEGNNLEAVKSSLAQRESSSNPKAVNKLGYVGKYQMGSAVLEDLGYLKKGSYKSKKNSALRDSSMFTGKDGINSLNDFLENEEIQDKAQDELMQMNYNRLQNSGVDVENMSPEEVAGALSAAHISGARGAKEFINEGVERTDAMGTKTSEYYDMGKKAIEEAKSAVDRQVKQQAAGDTTPESHVETTLAAINSLPIDEDKKDALEDEVMKIQTFGDAEQLKQLLDSLKASI